MKNWTPEKLKEFTYSIIEVYEKGKIKAPIHCSGGNEEQLIKLFDGLKITKNNYIFSTWRSSYVWLLSGRDPEELRKQILEGHSMHVYGDKFFTSAIVAGISPIALGVAWALKLKGSSDTVFCFLGDGGFYCGLSQESIRYAVGHDLPICFILEDNHLTVNAKTQEIWGRGRKNKVIKYDYVRKYGHAGHGLDGEKKYVMF